MEETIQSIGVVVIDGGKVLLVCHGEAAQHFTGIYGLPSGKVETSETPKDAAIRELKEETGLTAKRLFPLPTKYTATLHGKTGPRKFHWKVFHCTIWSGEFVSSDETTPEWVTFDRLEELAKEKKLLKNVKNAVEEARTFL